jgi:hypothetical protein
MLLGGSSPAATPPPTAAPHPRTVGRMFTPAQTPALPLDPAMILRAEGIEPDPWQKNLLLSTDGQILLLCSRGGGKSRTTSARASSAFRRPRCATVALPIGVAPS